MHEWRILCGILEIFKNPFNPKKNNKEVKECLDNNNGIFSRYGMRRKKRGLDSWAIIIII
jgi:hypothetical protein